LFRLLIVVFTLTGKFSRHKGWQVDSRSHQVPAGGRSAGRFHSGQHSSTDGSHAWCKRYSSLDDASLCIIAARCVSSCYDSFI